MLFCFKIYILYLEIFMSQHCTIVIQYVYISFDMSLNMFIGTFTRIFQEAVFRVNYKKISPLFHSVVLHQRHTKVPQALGSSCPMATTKTGMKTETPTSRITSLPPQTYSLRLLLGPIVRALNTGMPSIRM